MKTMKEAPIMEPRTLALVLGGAVGLGLVVHEVFLVVGAAVAVVAVIERVWRAARMHAHSANLVHHHS
jgi:hypothetical protein